MKRMKILAARMEIGDYGMACGPVEGPVVAEAELEEESGDTFFVSLAEVDGIPNIFKTEESTIDRQISSDEDEDFFDELNGYYIAPGDYDEIFENKDAEYYDVFRYLIYLVRCDENETSEFISNTVGKYLDEIEVPMSDIEEEFHDLA